MKPGEVSGKRFSVIGAARSGVAVARLLKQENAIVFVSDRAPEEKMAKAAAELKVLEIPCEFGTNTMRVLDADMLVLSPGVPSDMPLVSQAHDRRIRVLSEIEVASWFCPASIVAITGTNGKTTTTALTGKMFDDAQYPNIVAGNIGNAFSLSVHDLTPGSVAILEISSFQLDHVETFRPKVSVWLNVTPDHLDRYDHSYEKYILSKCRIFENQSAGDVLIYNADDETEREYVDRLAPAPVEKLAISVRGNSGDGAFLDAGWIKTRRKGVESDVIAIDRMSIPGMHNVYNGMAATLSALVMGIPVASIADSLKTFKGVEHRLEFVREVNGVKYVNDSKATNVDSVWYALQSFDRPIVLFLGGRDKGNDYARLSDLVRKHVRAIVAIGESAGKVTSAFSGMVDVTTATSMHDAVQMAARIANTGDVVLLSPACASFDWFENYEHRGKVFKQLVKEMKSM